MTDSDSSGSGCASNCRAYVPILPLALNLSTPAYYALSTMLYLLGVVLLGLSTWMIVEYYVLIRPYIIPQIKAHV